MHQIQCKTSYARTHMRVYEYSEAFRDRPYVVDISLIRTKRFASPCLLRTAKEWYGMVVAEVVFPDHYNQDIFKIRVGRQLLDKRVIS